MNLAAAKKKTSTAAKKKSTSNKTSSSRAITTKKGSSAKGGSSKPKPEEIKRGLNPQVKALLLVAAGILLLALVIIPGGAVWKSIHQFLFGIFGICALLVPVIFIYMGIMISKEKQMEHKGVKIALSLTVLIATCTLIYILGATDYNRDRSYFEAIGAAYKGSYDLRSMCGLLGAILGYPFKAWFTNVPAVIICVLVIGVSILLLTRVTLVDIAGDQARANASTEELMHAFDRLIGAASAKKKMENLLNQIKLNRRRAELTHVPFQNLSICFAFIGHPDTGQKEFRQAMTRVLSDIGLIEKDAVKTWQASQFLTTLTQNGAERRLIDEMLAQHGKTIYIIDANPSEWKEVEEQLPVLSEFINDRFVFDDYTPSELARLFIDYLHQQNMHLADDAQETLVGYFGSHAEGGRSEMKLLFNEVIFRQNTRLASAADISDEALVTIAKEDIPTD